jgi:hypothetical protein
MKQKDLLDLKDEIEEAKIKVTSLKGKKELLMSQLKEKWKCETVEEAEDLLMEKRKEVKTLSTKLDKKLAEIQEEYDS